MIKILLFFITSFFAAYFGISHFIGFDGLFGSIFYNYSILKLIAYMVIMAHITITCMSLSFHRFHTHKGMVIHPWIDAGMQIWLWLVTSMSKPDWVSVHTYHHAHSDTEKDPHSPVHKGFWRVFIFGVGDYTKAKEHPDVLKIRKTIKLTKLEKYISEHLFTGPYILSVLLLITFGLKFGAIMMVMNFLISPLFAVGGVNALAHTFGYRNHVSGDNSRNIGFLLPLNWIICGELDHNNHHAHQKSCSFRHKWYEFDVGYFYIKLLNKFKLIQIKYAYTPARFRQEVAFQVRAIMDKDLRFKAKLEELAQEFNTTYSELAQMIQAYIEGKKIKLDQRLKELALELKHTARANMMLNLRYA